jgi:hypothetical protein
MATIKVRGPVDPPQTSTNVVGDKRLRKKVQLAGGAGTLTVGNVRSCLPLTSPEFRVLKLSVWASAAANSLLSVLFPVRNPGFQQNPGSFVPGTPGDNSAWTDEGTQGALRPQVHLMPNFDFRNYWFTSDNVDTQVLAMFGGTATDLLVLDISVQYRTAVQGCPAMDLLLRMQDPSLDSAQSSEMDFE